MLSIAVLLAPIVGIFKAQRKQKAKIDSRVFELHYRTTTTLLMLCSILTTAASLIGNPITCVPGTAGGENYAKVLNNYCWFSHTFSVPPSSMLGLPSGGTDKYLGQEYAYPGVQPHAQEKSRDKVYHSYYQWVPLALILQAVFFYAPHLIWKVLEGKKMTNITEGLGRTLKMEDREKQKSELIHYLRETWNTHNMYAFKYFVCSILNLVNLILQCYMMNEFLGKAFLSYGTDYLKWTQLENEDRMAWEDPMIKVFPRVTKCTFHKYGHSGTIEAHDAICVLATNIINEKVYIALWLWFVVVGAITILNVLYIISLLLCRPMRALRLERKAKRQKDAASLINRKAQFGDWFMIRQLSKNMDKILFDDFILEFAESLKSDPPNQVV